MSQRTPICPDRWIERARRACEVVGLCSYEDMVWRDENGSLRRGEVLVLSRKLVVWILRNARDRGGPNTVTEIAAAMGYGSSASIAETLRPMKYIPGFRATSLLDRFCGGYPIRPVMPENYRRVLVDRRLARWELEDGRVLASRGVRMAGGGK